MEKGECIKSEEEFNAEYYVAIRFANTEKKIFILS